MSFWKPALSVNPTLQVASLNKGVVGEAGGRGLSASLPATNELYFLSLDLPENVKD